MIISSEDLHDIPHTHDEASTELATELFELENVLAAVSTRRNDASPEQGHQGTSGCFKITAYLNRPVASFSRSEVPDILLPTAGKEAHVSFPQAWMTSQKCCQHLTRVLFCVTTDFLRCSPVLRYGWSGRNRNPVHSRSGTSLSARLLPDNWIHPRRIQHRLRSTPI